MYTKFSARSRFFQFSILLFSLFALPPVAVEAAVIVSFDFDGPDGNLELVPEFSASGVLTSLWHDEDATLADFAGNPGRAVAARSWDDGNSLRFTLTPLPGVALSLDGFSFDQRASATGARAWSLQIAGIEVANGLTALAFAAAGGAFSLPPVTRPIDIALAGNGASSTAGTWRIDNFVLTGNTQALGVSTVPLPSTVALLLSSVFGFVGMRFASPA